mmetsp:Transcript_28776/g.61371  ORF Transcript_28776/g.61371 Transcript_28776/m.61371 type:complete len:223 (-) Transcript_28776:309-977(-)
MFASSSWLCLVKSFIICWGSLLSSSTLHAGRWGGDLFSQASNSSHPSIAEQNETDSRRSCSVNSLFVLCGSSHSSPVFGACACSGGIDMLFIFSVSLDSKYALSSKADATFNSNSALLAVKQSLALWSCPPSSLPPLFDGAFAISIVALSFSIAEFSSSKASSSAVVATFASSSRFCAAGSSSIIVFCNSPTSATLHEGACSFSCGGVFSSTSPSSTSTASC